MKHSLYILVLLTLVACKSKDSSLNIYTTPDGLSWQTDFAKGSYVYQLQTSVKSSTGAVRHVVISTFDPIYANQTILDSVLQDPVKDLKLITLYRTPAFEDTTSVKISTTAYTTDGESATYAFSIHVLPSEAPLQPVDGITLHSALSDYPSYFSLQTLQPVMKADSGSLYFRDVAPKDSLDELSYSWTSTKVYFSRSESFDYAKATASMVRNTYQSCTRDKTIQDLKEDDVLLFGTATEAMGVLKILVIEDNEGRNNDRYIFSIKALRKQ